MRLNVRRTRLPITALKAALDVFLVKEIKSKEYSNKYSSASPVCATEVTETENRASFHGKKEQNTDTWLETKAS